MKGSAMTTGEFQGSLTESIQFSALSEQVTEHYVGAALDVHKTALSNNKIVDLILSCEGAPLPCIPEQLRVPMLRAVLESSFN